MDNVETILEKQRSNARKWDKTLSQYGNVAPIQKDFQNPNFWVYGIRVNNKREAILDFREKGYYASGVHINNNIYSIFGDNTCLPGTDDFYSHFIALPCGWWMCEE